jgi:hypothetical protein
MEKEDGLGSHFIIQTLIDFSFCHSKAESASLAVFLLHLEIHPLPEKSNTFH